MKIFRVPMLLTILVITPVLAAESKVDEQLLQSANNALTATIDKKSINAMISQGLWNSDKSAVAVSYNTRECSIVYIFIRKNTGDYLPVNVSDVTFSNFGKLGFSRSHYERVVTEPTEWIPRKDSKLQVWIRTRAWHNGQRFTVAEPLLIDNTGKIFWR